MCVLLRLKRFVTGHPVKTIFWMKDGQSLRSGTPVDILKLPSVTREDQGMYQCFIKNEHDTAQAAGELRLGGMLNKY